MAVIKSSNVPTSAAAFSMRDIESAAKGILIRARERAEMLLVDAQREGEELKAQAYAEGLEEGRRAGREQGQFDGAKAGAEQALSEHKAQLTTVLTALTAAASAIEASRLQLASAGLTEVVTLAAAIARRVTKRQGMLDQQVLVDNLGEAMKLVAHAADVRIAIHPAQKAVLESALPALRMAWPTLKHVELLEDPTLAPGGCRIFTARGRIDADLDGQLDRVINDLLPGAEQGLPQRHIDTRTESGT